MKKFIYLLWLILFLAGCATYKFHRGDEPYHKGAKTVGELQTYEIGGTYGSVPITYRDIQF